MSPKGVISVILTFHPKKPMGLHSLAQGQSLAALRLYSTFIAKGSIQQRSSVPTSQDLNSLPNDKF